MRSLKFSRFSPAGNTTLFLHGQAPETNERLRICGQAQTDINVEQAGFADMEAFVLTMAGGEFCLNASRAFGALLDYSRIPENSGNFWTSSNLEKLNNLCGGKKRIAKARQYRITVSGLNEPVFLAVSGSLPHWQVAAGFHLSLPRLVRVSDRIDIIKLPGICHLIVKTECFPDAGHAPVLARELLAANKLENEDAAGVIWWIYEGSHYEIMPFVRVASVGTEVLETSCGSGSLALVLARKERQARVRQPGGAYLDMEIENDCARVYGPVDFSAKGELWLDV